MPKVIFFAPAETGSRVLFCVSFRGIHNSEPCFSESSPGENLKGKGESNVEECKKPALSEKEEKLLDIIRKVKFGEIKVIVQDGHPIRVEEIKKSIKL